MKRRVLAVVMTMALTVSMLAACGSGGSSQTTAAPAATQAAGGATEAATTAASAGEKTAAITEYEGVEKYETALSGELLYWSGFDGDSYIWDESRVKIFNELYADQGIHVTILNQSQMFEDGSLLAAFGSKSGVPDLILDDAPLSAYSAAAEGMFMAVDDVLPKVGMDVSNFFEGMKGITSVKGVTYLIPHDTNVHLLYYNKTLVKDANTRLGLNLDVEKGPQNLTELDQWVEALSIQEADGSYSQLGLVPWIGDGDDPWHIPYVFGANVYNTDTGELLMTEQPMTNYLEWIQGYAKKYGDSITRYGSATPGVFDPGCPFYTGEVAMYFCGNWAQNAIKLTMENPIDWGVCAVPAPEDGYGRPKATTFGPNVFGIVEGSQNAELAAFLVKFLIQPYFMENNFSQWYSIPCSDAEFDNYELTKKGDPMYALEREIANNPENGYPGLCSIAGSLGSEFQSARSKIINGADITSTMADLQTRMQAQLDASN
ncbi:MAG: extracellular solute-binding protein [Lachnospiraceae bacterium]|jgi:multiple sugar transport system substrate-binding protein|nr:extracellular solute-binding protein [Lachnospiraceae bacterium]